MKIPVYQPSLQGNEKKYVEECLDTTWISSKGKYVNKFEENFANYIGVDYATGVCNGTVAVHLALLALGIGPGDEVIVPTFTYIASVNPIRQLGAIPVFVDSLEDTWQMDPDNVKRKITSATKAIMVVHLYGHPCDMDPIMQIARENDLFVIEDCAEAIGSEYKGKKCGSFGDIAAFSFFGNKTITCGEGGMVITNDATLYDRASRLKGQGLARDREYWHDIVGYNYRMTNIQAAIGLAQFEQIQTFIDKKQEVARYYQENLSDLPIKMHIAVGNVFHTYWMNSILVNKIAERDSLRTFMKERGIETRPTFYPVHTMPMYAEKYQRHKVAENIALRGINIPSFPNLQKEQLEYICDTIKEFYHN